MPAGITVDASFKITYATTKEMVPLANYESDFYAKYSISNVKTETTIPAVTMTSTLTF